MLIHMQAHWLVTAVTLKPIRLVIKTHQGCMQKWQRKITIKHMILMTTIDKLRNETSLS